MQFRQPKNLRLPLRWILLLAAACLALCVTTARAERADVARAVDAHADQTWNVAQQIWDWAEPGYMETRSSSALATLLEEAGFKIERGVADIPTAFVATSGSGKPVIGILGEFDALPGLSQKAVPYREAVVAGGYGQACGHHLFGAASAAAAVAVAERIAAGELPGTVRFYGCPAEEGGGAKVFLVREGLFDDCDVVLHWHPGSRNAAGDSTCLARCAAKFRFYGKAAHAASSPEQGRSALDAVELTNHAAQLLREHTPDFTRIHHVITAGGGAPNVVPEFAEVYYYVRHPEAEIAREIYARLVKCAEAGALATETKLEIEYLGGTHQLLPNGPLAELLYTNLRALNDLAYTDTEREFALRLQTTLDEPKPLESVGEVSQVAGHQGRGSTDVGDVSWVVPTGGFSTACWVPGTPGHSWQAVAAGGTTIGRKGMVLAAKVLATTAYDLARDPRLIAAAQEDHTRRVGESKYEAMFEPGQKPPLDYRKSPVAD